MPGVFFSEEARHKAFYQTIAPGQVLAPWLVAGPAYTPLAEIPALTLFERPGTPLGLAPARAAIDKTAAALQSAAVFEGAPLSLMGQNAPFRALLTPEPYRAAGQYFMQNNLAVQVAAILLESPCAQEVTLSFATRRAENYWAIIDSRERPFHNNDPVPPRIVMGVQAAVNGNVVFDNEENLRAIATGEGDEGAYTFTAPLQAGENILTLCLCRIARNAETGFCLTLLAAQTPLRACLATPEETQKREALQKSVRSAHLKQELFEKGEPICAHVTPCEGYRIEAALTLNGHEIACAAEENGVLALGPANQIGAGSVTLAWRGQDGAVRDSVTLPCRVRDMRPPMPGYALLQKRKDDYLAFCAAQTDFASADGIYIVMANYRLGKIDAISDEAIEAACGFIDRRADCADFVLLPMLRLLHHDKRLSRLPAHQKERMKRSILGFTYWVDEGADSTMWFDSENHRIGFHTIEYLAGLLYPKEIFTESGQNGLFHAFKGRARAMEWLRQRVRFGFNEFHSDSYMPVTLSAILCLRDVSPFEEFALRSMAGALLQFCAFTLAVNTFEGGIAAPRGRTYSAPLKMPTTQGTYLMYYLLYGRWSAQFALSHGAVLIAYSDFAPPKPIYDLAYDDTPATFTFRQALFPMERGKACADYVIERTQDYVLCGLFKHNVGICEGHMHVAQVSLRGGITIFFSSPLTTSEGGGIRPDYFAGQASIPNVSQHANILAVTWKDVQNPFTWITHCYFESEKFDRVLQKDGWTFGQKAGGLVGIYSRTPHVLTREGPYTGRELLAPGRDNTWFVRCGQTSEFAGLDAFAADTLSRFADTGESLSFAHADGAVTVDAAGDMWLKGEKIVPEGKYASCPWLTAEYGSGVHCYHYGDWEQELIN